MAVIQPPSYTRRDGRSVVLTGRDLRIERSGTQVAVPLRSIDGINRKDESVTVFSVDGIYHFDFDRPLAVRFERDLREAWLRSLPFRHLEGLG